MPVPITVITVCLNAAESIEGTMLSVLGQDYPALEYIVIDGGSTDGTAEVVGRYRERLARFVSEPDGGIYDAFNKGIRLASGEIVGLLNAADCYAPWALRAVGDAAEADVLCGKMAVIDEGRGRWTVYSRTGSGEEHLESHMLNHPAAFVRRSAYERYGLFDAGFKIAGDWDLMLRFSRGGAVFRPVDRVLTAVRGGGVSWRPSGLLLRENARVFARWLPPVRAALKTSAMYVRALGRVLLDATGAYRPYANLRDAAILPVEAEGQWSGEMGDIWDVVKQIA
ncbi:MAG: glycosyltransferase [Synergistaceae bacterium]|jgi:glycosyltransferase involved in cell wall biosynthesis|nr:glycosyltransferase [Synergistaceae bacterium]